MPIDEFLIGMAVGIGVALVIIARIIADIHRQCRGR